METIKVALLGFGTVNAGVYQTIQTHQKQLQAVLGKRVEVVGVLIKNRNRQRKVNKNIVVTTDIEEILSIPDLDVVVEAIVGIEPGFSYLKKAIDKGLHIITANKELLAYKGKELRDRAQEKNVQIGYEATVAGGIPVINTLEHLIKINKVVKIEAILNGTTNYILSDIRENHHSFEHSLQIAQQKGYAEADPSNDIDGWDAFYKLMVVSDLVFGNQPTWSEVNHRGIGQITIDHITAADSIGCRIKHVASLEYSGGVVIASVEPILVSTTHSLYSVEGVENAILISGDIVGELKLQGPGAGALPTASAIVEDLSTIYRLNPTGENQKKFDSIKFSNLHMDSTTDWLLIGNQVPSTDVFAIQDNWEITGNQGHSVQCCVISGFDIEVRKWLKQQKQLTGYRIGDVNQIKRKVSSPV